VLTRLTLAAVLLGAAVLRLWRLDQNGYGNQYYTAGVRSMTTGWRNFLYNAFDPAGFVSVDKPPVALWIQVTSVKLFGFQGLSVLVPQVLEGVAAVWIVYHLVQRRFGAPAGLLAGLFLAVTPVSVAVDRSSNTESCLILVLLLAAWALIRAAEDGSRRFLLLSMALVGVGFNVKMLAAFVVLPAFALVYVLGGPRDGPPNPPDARHAPAKPGRASKMRWLVDAAMAALVLFAVSTAWIFAYDRTPPAKRPYAGTTDTNSIAELVVGPYGIGRFVRQVRPSVAAGGEPSVRMGVMASARLSAPAERPAEVGPRTGLARLFVRVPVGPLRLADGQLAGQVGWLLPLAIMGVVLGARRERFRRPLAPVHLSLILWFAWAVIYGVVYSAAGGIFHFYYLSMMAPPLAALGGIGVVSLWQCFREGGWRAVLLPVTLLVTAAWQLYVDASALGSWRDLFGDFAAVREQSGAWRSWLHVTLAGGALAAAGTLLIVGFRPFRTVALGALTLGVVSSLVLPVAWALSSVLVPGHGVLPSADLARLLTTDDDARARSRFIDPTSLATLIGFLRANRGKERYLLATSSTTLAAPIIIQTGEPVMARGGFHGLDPILTPEKLARMVEADELRFVMLGDLSLVSRRMGADIAGRPIADWVRANGKPVDPALWRGTRRGLALYDLRPDLGLRSANPPA
jgi:4-amino-4-deoxy-L-arabinose transferase-like glycosyltransferase